MMPASYVLPTFYAFVALVALAFLRLALRGR